jgi:hypothetical protein
MRIIRVFPRRTRATPDDDPVRVGPPGLFNEADEVHVSVTFTWDRERAEQLAHQWERVAPVKIGGVGWRSRSIPSATPAGSSFSVGISGAATRSPRAAARGAPADNL